MSWYFKRLWLPSIFVGVVLLVFCYLDGQLTCGAAVYQFTGPTNLVDSRYGWTLGPKTVNLRRGQTFIVNYEADIKRGSLHFRVDRGWYGVSNGSIGAHAVHASGSEQFKAAIPSDGWYRLTISGRADGGCDLDYFAKWSAQSVE
jgi:hypothetical protein